MRGQFVRGPIPLAWLEKASRLRSKACLLVALAIWYRRGIVGEHRPIKVTNKLVGRFGVTRRSKYAALKALANAGLVKVTGSPRKTPTVTVILVEETPD
jgi:hypothetical protein